MNADETPGVTDLSQITGQPQGTGWEEVPPTLPALGILSNLTQETLATIATFGKYHTYPVDEIVICENEHLERFYIVMSGTVEVFTTVNSNHVVLCHAEAGECLGEVSLLDPGLATASVRARTECNLWSMSLDDLHTFLSSDVGAGGALLLGMSHCLADRIRHADDLIFKTQEAPKLEEMIRSHPPIKATVPAAPISGGFFSKLKNSLGATKKVKIPTEIKM